MIKNIKIYKKIEFFFVFLDKCVLKALCVPKKVRTLAVVYCTYKTVIQIDSFYKITLAVWLSILNINDLMIVMAYSYMIVKNKYRNSLYLKRNKNNKVGN